MKENTSAFPIFDEVTGKIFPGMTLRDYFAGQALAGMTAQIEEEPQEKAYAYLAYAFVDAMLVEREKRK